VANDERLSTIMLFQRVWGIGPAARGLALPRTRPGCLKKLCARCRREWSFLPPVRQPRRLDCWPRVGPRRPATAEELFNAGYRTIEELQRVGAVPTLSDPFEL
jgi:hypothetical protein